MRKQVATYWVFIGVFAAILILPNLGFLFQTGDVEVSENRSRKPFPEFTENDPNLFSQAFEAYYNDRFLFRSSLIQADAALRYTLFKTSASPKVLIGKSGFLFYNYGDMLPDYWGLRQHNEDYWNNYLNVLKRLHSQVPGVKFVMVIAPNKSTVYPEFLPDRVHNPKEPTRFEQLLGIAFKKHVDFIPDLRQCLKENKPETYHKTDTHWSHLGAKYAVESVFKTAGLAVTEPKIVWTPQVFTGDLARMSGIPGIRETRMVPDRNTAAYYQDTTVIVPEGVLVLRNPNAPNKLTVYLAHDSFGAAMRDILILYCETVILGPNIRNHIPDILSLEPDLIVYEIVERNLPDLLNYGF